MHILHLGKYYTPHRGGIERVLESLCRGVVERGHEVTALVSNSAPHTVDEELHGVRVLRLARPAVVRSQPLNTALLGALQQLDFDVLHVHTPNPVAALVALAAARGRPIVVSHHSDIVQQKLLGVPGTLAHAALYARASTVVVATPPQVAHSPLLRRFRDKCRVIPFAAPSHTPRALEPAPLPAAFGAEPFALFVGRLVHYKGLHVLIDALSRCRDLRLAIVGTGPLRQRLERQIGEAGVQERVALLGDVEEGALQSLYAACRFLVLPSIARSEAFGMVQLEAMAAGRPVLSTNLPSGVPYVNQHQRTGLLVEPGDSTGLAAAMQRLADDEELCARLGRAGRARAGREFALNNVLEQWLDVYTELEKAD